MDWTFWVILALSIAVGVGIPVAVIFGYFVRRNSDRIKRVKLKEPAHPDIIPPKVVEEVEVPEEPTAHPEPETKVEATVETKVSTGSLFRKVGTVVLWMLIFGVLIAILALLILNYEAMRDWALSLIPPSGPAPDVPADPAVPVVPATPPEPVDWSWVTTPWNEFVALALASELWGVGLFFFLVAVLFTLFKNEKVSTFFGWLGAIVLSVAVAELLLGIKIATLLGSDPTLLGALLLLGVGVLAFLLLKSKVLGFIAFALGLLVLLSTLPILGTVTGLFSGVNTIMAPVGECSTPLVVRASDDIDWWGEDPEGESFRVRYTNRYGTWMNYVPGTKPTMRAICFVSNEVTAQKVHYRFVRKS